MNKYIKSHWGDKCQDKEGKKGKGVWRVMQMRAVCSFREGAQEAFLGDL